MQVATLLVMNSVALQCQVRQIISNILNVKSVCVSVVLVHQFLCSVSLLCGNETS